MASRKSVIKFLLTISEFTLPNSILDEDKDELEEDPLDISIGWVQLFAIGSFSVLLLLNLWDSALVLTIATRSKSNDRLFEKLF